MLTHQHECFQGSSAGRLYVHVHGALILKSVWGLYFFFQLFRDICKSYERRIVIAFQFSFVLAY